MDGQCDVWRSGSADSLHRILEGQADSVFPVARGRAADGSLGGPGGYQRLSFYQQYRCMRFSGLIALLIALSLLIALDALAQTKLPDGKGRAVFERMCTGCHGVESIVRARNSRER